MRDHTRKRLVRMRALLVAGTALTALAASHLDAAALTSGTALPTGNGSSVFTTGAVGAVPSPVTVIDNQVNCIASYANWIDGGLTAQPAASGLPWPPLACMVQGTGLAGGPTVSADATWVGVTSSAGGYVVTMTCQAAASVGISSNDAPLSTTVNNCYLHGADGIDYLWQNPQTMPGATALVQAVSASLPVQRYQVCVAASASYLGGTAPTTGAPTCM